MFNGEPTGETKSILGALKKDKPSLTWMTPVESTIIFSLPGVSMTLEKSVNDPIILGNDPIFQGSWRLQVELAGPGKETGNQHRRGFQTLGAQ